ncbi:MAG TPA: nicotinate-nucleotide--dimethylbenzimidazole phosphoribosyltransferase [Nitrospirae bacterium]|nr:nicotinate-nucleotide--dimethylbenzimidazole phosphoribosyltransferase [bacterium BMS3Bbin05]HDO21525.1 nicotinate-nucleotide--dimethylbenzimidazole phosphoribosyltransferase [Nitrospirota bacterium]HDO36073.1 nicotinate-nucleotide--dimethylbenzimidazole phosphoribosyltransferase [Nitrospirota bacterium]HDZ88173.1 nicotinate-nucleotide--dimethylbenzimidazole phosphoribosyltransferase [Nitrospirota bacterium]
MSITETFSDIKPVGKELCDLAQRRLDNLTKPPGSLGRLEEFARRLVAIYGKEMPELPKKAVFTFAGDHGVAGEGVSAYPAEVTPQMVFNFINGGAGINVLARHAGAEVVVVDIGVNYDFDDMDGLIKRKVVHGTGNIAKGPAMTGDEAIRCLEAGTGLAHEYADKGYTMFAAGDMGIANTTPSSAIVAAITGRRVYEVTGRGTGIGDEALSNKVRVIEKALAVNKPDPKDAVDVLARVGGAEIGGIAGLCLGAAARGIPVVIDGFISTAGALIAYTMNPAVADYLFAAHNSVEAGHGVMLDYMGLRPILDLDLRLGEGTGAAMAMMLIEAGLRIYREMATFGEAGVTGEKENRDINKNSKIKE